MQTISQITDVLDKHNVVYTVDEPLSNHTTFKIGGRCSLFCEPHNIDQLIKTLDIVRKLDFPFFLLGRGSNVLFKDDGYRGMVIHLAGEFLECSRFNNSIKAGAAAKVSDVSAFACDESLQGMEFAYGIPGSVGGAVFMNAGAFGGNMAQVVHKIAVLDDTHTVQSIPADELHLDYRTSAVQRQKWIVLFCYMQLEPGDQQDITALMQKNMTHRENKQPLDKPSAGSAFKRPEGAYAGALIDQCGLRGFRCGDAAISEKHAGFIVNLGTATATDVMCVADEVAAIVKEKTGYTLEKEIRVIESFNTNRQ